MIPLWNGTREGWYLQEPVMVFHSAVKKYNIFGVFLVNDHQKYKWKFGRMIGAIETLAV